ncbi:MAG: glycoside hydrolase family 3 C-terminal domain-containing protein [Bacteroidales bacterium]|nr:glycoside hydrolase family 3 C-terminal domain-containing protein [Bacteroidales bacterium]
MRKHINIVFAGILISVLLVSCAIEKGSKQPVLGTKSVSVVEKNGLQFKDLNKNGKLDPYEDWRLTAEERAEDLSSRMTLEEKAGLMHITSERRRGGGIPGGGAFPGRAAGAEPGRAAGAEPGRAEGAEAVRDAPGAAAEDPFPLISAVKNGLLPEEDLNPAGKLPFTIPKDQEAVRKNASDVPGYAEDFDYVYTDRDGNAYTFGFGISY